MRTFTRFWLFALMTFFASSVIAQQAAIQQTGTSRPDKMELIQQLHGPTMQVVKQMEGQTRATGDDCTAPLSVTYGNLPYADNNQTTENRFNTYSSTCLNDFDGGEDIVYELDLSQDATLIFNLDPKGTAHSGMALSETCGWSGVCLAVSTDTYGTGAAHGFTIALDAGIYYLIIDTWPSPDFIPDFDLTITETTTVANDDCADAIEIGEVLNLAFSTEFATDDGPLTCTDGNNIWYKYVPTFTGPAVFDLCSSDYDTQLGVWDACNGTRLDCNDDFCGYDGIQSKVIVAVTTGTPYWVEIGGFDGSNGEGLLSIYEFETCTLTCPPAGIDENEPCGDDTNGGCNMVTPAFTSVSSGDVICGNAWADGGTRDTDWFELVLDHPSNITFTGEAEAPVVIGLIGQLQPGVTGCENITGFLSRFVAIPSCVEDSFQVINLQAGTYYLFLAPLEYFNYPCDPDGGFGYLATFSVEEVPAGFLSGVVVGSDVALGLEGVSVTTDVYSTYTTNTGNYLIEVPVGTYDVTADGYDLGYSTETQTGIIVTEGNITTASFVLDPEDVPNLQAAVADIEEVTLVWDPIAPKKDGGRTLIGDVASNNDYVPNTTMDLEFTMTVYSPDFEWADYASMVFPPDFEPISASALNGIAATIVGQTVYWSGYFYTEDLPEEIDFTVEVTIDVAAAGPYGLDYYVSGDEYGGYPHFFEGAVTIYDDGGTYVPTFNIYRQLGRAFIPIAYGVIGNTYVDEIYPGGDEWCYYVTQILADGTESPASNIRCATPLVRPGTLCSDPLDYGAVNDVAQTDDLVRPFDVRWYEVDVPYTMDVAFSLCNSDFDTQIAVYDSCADFTGSLPDGARGYNDDSDCGNDDYQSLLILELLPGGTYFVAVYGYDDDYGTFELEITQVQVLTISENWSGFSIYIDPTGSTNIADVLDEVADDMIITIRQSPFGLWWPSQNINSIVDISPEVGYKAKMETEPKAEYETVVFGSEVVDKSVTLPVGVSYLPVKVSAPTDASDLVTQLGADLLLIFDIHTNEIIWPEGGLATLTSLVPDNAYLINMINASTYTYPVPVLSPVPSHTPDYSNRTSWNDVVNTGITHFISIAVSAQTEFKAGDVIGVFDTEGTCVGVTEYLEKGTNLFLPVSGNDGYTDTKDGMNEGEAMQFKLYRNGETIELEATFGVQMPNYDGLFMENGISMITGFKLGETSIFENEFAGVNIYPNPSAGVLNISGLEKNAEVTVTNSQGQVVYSGIIGTDTQLDLSKQSKGIYFIRLMNENSVKIEKVVLK